MVIVLGRFEEVLGVIRTCRSRHLEGVLDVLSDSEDEVEVHLTVFGDGSGTRPQMSGVVGRGTWRTM